MYSAHPRPGFGIQYAPLSRNFIWDEGAQDSSTHRSNQELKQNTASSCMSRLVCKVYCSTIRVLLLYTPYWWYCSMLGNTPVPWSSGACRSMIHTPTPQGLVHFLRSTSPLRAQGRRVECTPQQYSTMGTANPLWEQQIVV